MKVKAEDLQGLKQLETFAGILYNSENFNNYVRAMQEINHRPRNYLLQLGTSNPFNPTFGKAVIFVSCNILSRGRGLPLVLPIDVEQLYLSMCRRWRFVCEVFSFNIAKSLKYCEIFDCEELEYLFCFSYTCSFCSSLQNLESVKLSVLSNLRFLWKETDTLLSDTLFRLRFVKISSCYSLKTLLTPEIVARLQSLEKLHVEYCDELKEIFSVEDKEQMGEELSGADQSLDNNSSDRTKLFLPKLVSLLLEQLPQLTNVCRGEMHCNSLQVFRIDVCPKLEELPRTVPWFQIDVTP
ncbi:hypothetical protein L6164_018504 [Bauhinia variegata]|uniref:Uncharacterized protein n=1 Tax=Bauhinia variegata TaxID=167791 RepID=A0ACB9NBF0_BAUVA|nr:hypothetical protein L6164_018504 [Bauhinia variegata]